MVGSQTGIDNTTAIAQCLTTMTEILASQQNAAIDKIDKKGIQAWPAPNREGFLIAVSPDPTMPLEKVPDSIATLLNLPSGLRITLHVVAENSTMDWDPDVATFNDIKKGNILMNEHVNPLGSVRGVFTPFCCPPHDRAGNSSTEALARLQTGMELRHLSAADIKLLSCQKFFILNDHMTLHVVLDNFQKFMEIWFTKDSFTFARVANLVKNIKANQQHIKRYLQDHGISFSFSLLSQIHTCIAIWINKCISEPADIEKEDLDFAHIKRALRHGNFMNLYGQRYMGDGIGNATGQQQIQNNANPIDGRGGRQGTNGTGGRADQIPGNTRNPTPQDPPTSTKVVNPFRGTQTAINSRKFAIGRKKHDENFTKIPKIFGVQACLRWFATPGSCKTGCPRASTHIELTGDTLTKMKAYVKKCEENAPGANGAGA